MPDDVVVYSAAAGVAEITLNRPRARNAMNAALADGLVAAFSRAEADANVRVIVVTGTDPAFCAGLDLKEFASLGRPPAAAAVAIDLAGDLAKPTIGAVNGPAMTGGLELVLGLDILIASEHARFGDTHAAVGMLPGGGMTARLPRAVGAGMALEMSYTGRMIDATEALRIGLVNRVVEHGALLTEARALAEVIAERDPAVLLDLKRMYKVGIGTTLDDGLAHERAARDERRRTGRSQKPTITSPADLPRSGGSAVNS